MARHNLTHYQRDSPDTHISSNNQERNPRRTSSWRHRDKNDNQLHAQRVMTTQSNQNVQNDANRNFEDNWNSQLAHGSSIMCFHCSNSHNSTMTDYNPKDSSMSCNHSISNNKLSFTGHIATSGSTVLATILSFTKPNFKLRRINQSLASNSVTTMPRSTVESEISSSHGAVVDKQEVRRVTEGNEVSQETSNLAPKCLNKVDNQIQRGATGTMRRSGLTGTSPAAFPVMPKRAIELERCMKKGLHKNWISRFINMQRMTKSTRSNGDTRRRPISGWGFASRKAEYLKLGLELSYEDVKVADWKLQNPTSSSSKLRKARKARPGKSNLRYCLKYTNQASHGTSESTCDWSYDRMRRWLSFGDQSMLCSSFE